MSKAAPAGRILTGLPGPPSSDTGAVGLWLVDFFVSCLGHRNQSPHFLYFLYAKKRREMSREEVIRGWEAIAEYLGVHEKTVQRWYHGYDGSVDPCGLRQAVSRVGRRMYVARESELHKCWLTLTRPGECPLETKRD